MEEKLLYLLGGGIGGTLITSIIGPYLIQSKERRAARAAVFKVIMAVEQARWHDADTDYMTLKSKIAEFKAASLIARADRGLTEFYAHISIVCYRAAKEEDFDEGELVWVLPVPLPGLADDALEILTKTLWHPGRTYLLRRWFHQSLVRKELEAKKELEKQGIPVSWK